ncbi:MAG TPA: hypothetical protein VHT28_04230 [Silvibacterium sp.]|nr:hypothetical protein [Silvibacterium sp.]
MNHLRFGVGSMPRTVLCTSIVVALASASAISAQQAPSLPSSEIHVDEHCRVLTVTSPQFSISDLRPDAPVCKVDYQNHSSHWEQNIVDGTPQSSHVTIHEREYLLHNPAGEPVTFVVDQSLPEGWQIDSDPQPTEITDGTATFRVVAQPGQTVRLHIGKRKAVEPQT